MPYNPGIQDRSGDYLAQGIGQLGEGIQRGMMSYMQNKTMASQALGKFEATLQANPDILKFLNPEEPSPNAPSDVVKAYMKLQKDGTVGVRDASMLSTFADTYTKAKEDKQQQEMRAMQMQNMQMQMAEQKKAQAESDQMNARFAQMAALGRNLEGGTQMQPAMQNGPAALMGRAPDGPMALGGADALGRGGNLGGGGVLRPEVSERMKQFMQSGVGNAAAQGIKLTPAQAVALQQGDSNRLNASERAQLAAESRLEAAGLRNELSALKATAAATKLPQKYQSLGHVVAKDGTYLGASVLDQTTAETGLMKNGKIIPLPEGAEPITATGIQKNVPGSSEFRKLKSDLTDAETSLVNMDRYMNSVGDANIGIQRMADKFSSGMKTLVGKKDLNPKEIAAKMAEGQLQGLLGSNRTNIVGGGVMTEQDALRIIQRLGGDFDSLSNPEIVRAAIAQVYSDRFRQYDDDFNFYNAAVNSFYGSKSNGAFKNADRVAFSHNFGGEAKASNAKSQDAQDEASINFLEANPTDPRAAKIRADLQSRGWEGMGSAASPAASKASDLSALTDAELKERLRKINQGKK